MINVNTSVKEILCAKKITVGILGQMFARIVNI